MNSRIRAAGQTSARPASANPLTAHHALRRRHRLDVVQRDNRALVPSHVLDRARDFALLDQEQAVASQSGDEDRLRIERADVPEARHEHAALGARDQVGHGGVAAIHDQVARALPSASCPSCPPRTASRTDPSARRSRPRRSAIGRPSLSNEMRRRQRMRGIRVDAHLLADELIADAVAAALLREEAAPFVRLPCVGGENHEGEQVRDRCRLEDHRVLAGLDRRGVLRHAPPCRSPSSASAPGCEQAQLVERLRRPSRAGAVRRPRGQVVVGGGEAVVGEQPFRARDGLRSPTDVSTKPADTTSFFLLRAIAVSTEAARHSGDAEAASSKKAFTGAYVCGTESRHRFRVFRRQPGDLLGVAQRALQAGIVELRGRDSAGSLAETSP